MFFTQFQFVNTYFRSDPPVLVRDIDNFGDPRSWPPWPTEPARRQSVPAIQRWAPWRVFFSRSTRWCATITGSGRSASGTVTEAAVGSATVRNALVPTPALILDGAGALPRSQPAQSITLRSWMAALMRFPLMPHRTALGLNRCWRCEADLALAPAVPALPGALAYSGLSAAALDQGWVSLGPHTFHYLRCFSWRSGRLRGSSRLESGRSNCANDLGKRRRSQQKPFDLSGRNAIEFLDASETHRLHALAWPLLKDWPSGYVEHMRAAGVWAAWATKDLIETPFVLRQIVDQHLRLDLYSPPFAEVLTAVRVMSGQGHRISNRSMRRVIGDSQFLGPAISLFRSSITPAPPSRRALRQAATRSAPASERYHPPSATRAVIVRTIRSE